MNSAERGSIHKVPIITVEGLYELTKAFTQKWRQGEETRRRRDDVGDRMSRCMQLNFAHIQLRRKSADIELK
jgi:hypothetical protein